RLPRSPLFPYTTLFRSDPMTFLQALRRCADPDALTFVDVTAAEHWAAEVYETVQPRTFFNPTDNQAMGWSIPAALGAQRVHPGRDRKSTRLNSSHQIIS